MRNRIAVLMAGFVLFGTATAWAQGAWDSPQLVPPVPPAAPEFGIYVIDASGAGVGVLGMWRGGAQPRMGLRFGIAERTRPRRRNGSGITALGGMELLGTVTRATADFPLDIAWFFGIGAGVDDRVRLSIPLGLSAGHTFTGDGVMFNPYLSPRVVLDGVFGSGGGLDLGLAIDLGIDIAVQPTWLIRFGGTFGDRSALALGVAF